MYDKVCIEKLILEIEKYDGCVTKDELSKIIQKKFSLRVDRKVFVGDYFSIRFSFSKGKNPSNTVLSLAKLKKYDSNPFFVCIVTPEKNNLLIANSTFIKKISHSSQSLTIENIRGSFNIPDIVKEFENISNSPENFEELYHIHENYSFEDNLSRIVCATNNIVPSGKIFVPTAEQRKNILEAPKRTIKFMMSDAYQELAIDLDNRTASVKMELQMILKKYDNNVNIRGRLVEYFITSNNLEHKKELYQKIQNDEIIDDLTTEDGLGDYFRKIGRYEVATDIKSKLISHSSAPKGYNVDKLLAFLSNPNSVYLLYIVVLKANEAPLTELVSAFQKQILERTNIQRHWAGRNSRGVAQFDGNSLEYFLDDKKVKIDIQKSRKFLENLLGDEWE